MSNDTRNNIIVIIVGSLLIVSFLLLTGYIRNPFFTYNLTDSQRSYDTSDILTHTTTGSDIVNSYRNNKDTNTCTITDMYGRVVTLTGDINDPQFQRLCTLPYQQQIYLYNYPYFISNGHTSGHGGHGGHH